MSHVIDWLGSSTILALFVRHIFLVMGGTRVLRGRVVLHRSLSSLMTAYMSHTLSYAHINFDLWLSPTV